MAWRSRSSIWQRNTSRRDPPSGRAVLRVVPRSQRVHPGAGDGGLRVRVRRADRRRVRGGRQLGDGCAGAGAARRRRRAGRRVVTSAFTYFASVEAILLAGARPVFADIEKHGFGVDPGSRRSRARAAHACDPADPPVRALRRPAAAAGAGRRARHRARRGRRPEPSAHPRRPARRRLGARRLLQLLPVEEPRRRRGRRLRHDRRPGGRRARPALPQPRQLARWRARRARHDGPARCAAGRGAARETSVSGWLDAAARPQRADHSEILAGCEEIEVPVCELDGRRSGTSTPSAVAMPRACARRSRRGIEWRHYYPMPAASQPALGAARCAAGSFQRRSGLARGDLASGAPELFAGDDRADCRCDPPGGGALASPSLAGGWLHSAGRRVRFSDGSRGSRRRRPRTPRSCPGRPGGPRP